MITKPYNSKTAVDYAHKWAFLRNPRYYDFHNIGGDCTNFCSQCLYNSCGVMNYTPTYGWYYNNINDRTPSWTGVEQFYQFLIHNTGIGPFATAVDISQIAIGDIVQLSFNGHRFSHSLLVVSSNPVPTIFNTYIATHTLDSDNRPISSYEYENIRFLHILGFRTYE